VRFDLVPFSKLENRSAENHHNLKFLSQVKFRYWQEVEIGCLKPDGRLTALCAGVILARGLPYGFLAVVIGQLT